MARVQLDVWQRLRRMPVNGVECGHQTQGEQRPMTKVEVHDDTQPVYMLGEISDGVPSQWAAGTTVPNICDVPEELIVRYKQVMPTFFRVQEELGRLYGKGTPADAVRPKPQ
jgi:hypothetical protein